MSEIRGEETLEHEPETEGREPDRDGRGAPKQLGIAALAHDTAIYGGTRVLLKSLTFFLVPLYAHYLTRDQMGVLALVLATVGLYGVIAAIAAQRTPEIGMRMALGARTLDIVTLILKQAFGMIGAGIAMLILPGPALAVIPIGLGMLALEFAWAEKLLEIAVDKAEAAGRAAQETSAKQRIIGFIAIGLAVGAAVAAAIAWDIPLLPE